MAEDRPRGLKAQVKGPLIIAAALALAAFFAVFVFATGGTHNKPNIGLALGVAGAVFIVTLVVCATLILVVQTTRRWGRARALIVLQLNCMPGQKLNEKQRNVRKPVLRGTHKRPEPKRKQPRMMLIPLRRLTANRRAEAVC